MDNNDSVKFKELISMISENYNDVFSNTKIKLWWSIFKPYSISEFESGVFNHVSCPDYGMFAPKPANIMKFITGTEKQSERLIDDRAEIAWHVIEGEIRRIGSYGTLQLEDKQALVAVKALGGWKHLCSLTVDKMIWAHKEFVAAYQNYERTPVELLPDKLAGRIEIEQHKAEQGQSMKSLNEGLKDYQNRIGNNGK